MSPANQPGDIRPTCILVVVRHDGHTRRLRKLAGAIRSREGIRRDAAGLRTGRAALPVGARTGPSAQSVGDALIRRFTHLSAGLWRTLAWDQGNEMFHHHRIETATGLTTYFCDPHAPWQRGTKENTNGLLRQYFPKGTDLGTWISDPLDRVATELNHRPRAFLHDKSPHEMMQQWERRLIAEIIRNDH